MNPRFYTFKNTYSNFKGGKESTEGKGLTRGRRRGGRERRGEGKSKVSEGGGFFLLKPQK